MSYYDLLYISMPSLEMSTFLRNIYIYTTLSCLFPAMSRFYPVVDCRREWFSNCVFPYNLFGNVSPKRSKINLHVCRQKGSSINFANPQKYTAGKLLHFMKILYFSCNQKERKQNKKIKNIMLWNVCYRNHDENKPLGNLPSEGSGCLTALLG